MTCDHCGEEFYPTEGCSSGFCSDLCWDAYYAAEDAAQAYEDAATGAPVFL